MQDTEGRKVKVVAVIPARYKSSRFEGKPLQEICGKPMVWWVYQEAKKVKSFERVIVATEDQRIVDACNELGMEVMMTADTHPTGTDRVAEVAQKVDADLYVIIMGDEPLISAEDEQALVDSISGVADADAIMLTEKFKNPVDVVNTTTIKLAINNNKELVFMSRMPIPYPKAALGYSYYKNIGCYALRKEALDFFLKTKPGCIEEAEEIELLRLLENRKKVLTVLVDSESMAVDTPKDLERIRKVIAERENIE
jgi:3-deoxy-manno-octulosonate cytidylyltransferase (CMP-KDO synthetase)